MARVESVHNRIQQGNLNLSLLYSQDYFKHKKIDRNVSSVAFESIFKAKEKNQNKFATIE